jgi:hypothetical protein
MVAESHIEHIRRALSAAVLETEPGAHMVIPDILPADLYESLLDTIPPPEGFDVADDSKANFDPESSTLAPERSRQSWLSFHRDVLGGVLTPLLLERFKSHIEIACSGLFGPALAAEAVRLPRLAFRGRLMLRRPGYRLRPHRDTKIAALTGLIYFARPGDNAQYGTDIYRVDNDQQAPSMKTFYPHTAGGQTTLVRSVPFVGNSALFFVNTLGMAHAASFPTKAKQRERYSYQFYIGPSVSDLARLVERMSPEEAALWSGVRMPEHGY